MLHMLPVRFRSYQTSVLRHILLILDTYRPDTKRLREQGCENPWLFFEAKMGPRSKRLGNTGLRAPIFNFTNYCGLRHNFISQTLPITHT